MTHHPVQAVWSAVTAVAACLVLPGSVELLLLSVAALLPRRAVKKGSVLECHNPWRVAIVLPAHNEELSIGACVRSLQDADHADMQVHIVVVADNCIDATAAVARAVGAAVLERTDTTQRGKGHALHFAFTHLESHGFDCVLVVDADTQVAPNFIVAAAGAMRGGAAAVQTRYLVSNLAGNSRTRLMGLALRAFNVVRPLGREHLGLSVGILGNGFGLTRETLRAVPYLASSVVEDLEYHLSLVRSGRRVRFVNETTVFGEMPVRGKGVETQRTRWEGGRIRMMVEKSPSLIRDILMGRWRSLEPLLELLLLPLAFHVALLMVVLSSPLALVRGVGVGALAIVLLHLSAAISVGDSGWRDAATLAVAPAYLLWKLMLLPAMVRNARSNNAWVRTARNAEVARQEAPAPGGTESGNEAIR